LDRGGLAASLNSRPQRRAIEYEYEYRVAEYEYE
jgi:hypothetical protein